MEWDENQKEESNEIVCGHKIKWVKTAKCISWMKIKASI